MEQFLFLVIPLVVEYKNGKGGIFLKPLTEVDFQRLKEGFEFYHKYLKDNVIEYSFCDEDNYLCSIKVTFKAHNFQHLSGVEYGDYSANKFYKDLLNNKIDRKLLIYKNSYTKLKLQALSSLKLIVNRNQVRVTKGSGANEKLVFDNLIRSKKKIFAIACRTRKQGDISDPISLLNLKSSKIDNIKSFPVVNIQIKKTL